MAVPKYKTSRSKRDQRRGQIKISNRSLSVCTNCGSLIRPHRVCPHCGYFKGVQILENEEHI